MAAQFNGITFFNVQTYGAKGDGATDDRVAIQAAITAASTAGGGIVWFPQGDYVVSQNASTGYCLWLPSYVHLRGVGAYSRIQTSDTTADTVRVRSVATTLAGFAVYWSIRELHFNPLSGTARTSTAAEIAIGPMREGMIDSCGFGRRNALNIQTETPTTAEESRVGTCIQIGQPSSGVIGSNIKVNACHYTGIYQFIKSIDTADCWISNSGGDANNVVAVPIYLTGDTESFMALNCDFVNTKNVDGHIGSFTSSSVCCLIDSSLVRFNSFTNCYFDTQYHGIYATDGSANLFVNCWFSNRPGNGAHIGGSATGYTFMGCMFANNGGTALDIASGGSHIISGNRFFANGVSSTSGNAHVIVRAATTGVRLVGNTFSTNGSGISGGTMPWATLESGATKVRVEQNDAGGLSITNNAGSGAVVQNND